MLWGRGSRFYFIGGSMQLVLKPLKLSGFTTDRKQKLVAAIQDIEAIINGAEFIDWFMVQKFTQLEGELAKMSQADLLAKLLREIEFNYMLQSRSWWKRFSKVIGWFLDDRNTKGLDIYTYYDSFDGMSISGLAGHITHEVVCHGSGFSHSYEWNNYRDFSLPYAVGNKIEELSRKRRKKLV